MFKTAASLLKSLGTTLVLLLLLIPVVSLRADQADSAYGCTPKVFSATATWYDNSSLGLSACHYSDPTLPGGSSRASQYYAAAATHLYDDGICGACAEITDSGNGKKVTVMVTDECPAASNPTHCYSGSNHLDISVNAFTQLEAQSVGVFNITWKVVPCPLAYLNVKGQNGANLSYQFKSGASSGWAAIIIRDYIMPIKSVEYCTGSGSGCSAAAWQRSYNGWVPSGTWNSFYLRITDKSGNQRNFGPISCCSPVGTDSKTETSSVYGNVPGGQMPGCVVGTPTFTPASSFTSTATPTYTRTLTASPTLTFSASRTPSPSLTVTPTLTLSSTRSASPTATLSSTGTRSATPTATLSSTPAYSSTFTPTATRSATPSSTLTSTPAATLTFTVTATRSATPAASFTFTRTASPTATLSSSPTLTVTPAGTFTFTRSATPSSTLSATPVGTATFTRTASPTATLTVSATLTSTPAGTLTFTRSATPSSTLSATPLGTATFTRTATSTATLTPLASATHTPTVTPTSTLSPPYTATDTPTLSATPSISATSSATASHTPTLTSTSTSTFTSGPSSTSTATPSLTRTATPTLTQSPVVTATFSPTQGAAPPTALPSGELVIDESVPLPDPNPNSLAILLRGDCEDLHLKIYTPAMALVLEQHSGPKASGWTRWTLPSEWSHGLAPGMYYGALVAKRGTQTSQRKLVRLLILR